MTSRRRKSNPAPAQGAYHPAALHAVANWLGRPPAAGEERPSPSRPVAEALSRRLRDIAAIGPDSRMRSGPSLITAIVSGAGTAAGEDDAGRIAALIRCSSDLSSAALVVFPHEPGASDLAFTLSVCLRMEAARLSERSSPDSATDGTGRGFLAAYRETFTGSVALVRTGTHQGSAFCVRSENGSSLWLTAAHVLHGDERADLYTNDGSVWESSEARVVRTWDDSTDLATLATDAEAPPLGMGGAPFSDADVYAFAYGGRPADFLPSVIRGRITRSYERDGLGFIDADAAVFPGNSGGPLLDIWGSVAGVIQRSNEGFVVALSVSGIPAGALEAP